MRPSHIKCCHVCEGTGIICSENVENGPLGTRPELCMLHETCETMSCLLCDGVGFVPGQLEILNVKDYYLDYAKIRDATFNFSIQKTDDLIALLVSYKEALQQIDELEEPSTEMGRQLHSELAACRIILSGRSDVPEEWTG